MKECDVWLMELVPLAEEIRHGKGSPEKASRLAELVLLLNAHLFDGGDLPQAWFVPLATDFGIPTIPPGGLPLEELGNSVLDSDRPGPLFPPDEPFHDFPPEDESGVHDIGDFDLSDFEDPAAGVA